MWVSPKNWSWERRWRVYVCVCVWVGSIGCSTPLIALLAPLICLSRSPSLSFFSFLSSVRWCPACGISSLWHVTGWRCDSCPYARPCPAKVTTRTHTLNRQCSRQGQYGGKDYCPSYLPISKCHGHRHGAAWVTQGLLRKDEGSCWACFEILCPSVWTQCFTATTQPASQRSWSKVKILRSTLRMVMSWIKMQKNM